MFSESSKCPWKIIFPHVPSGSCFMLRDPVTTPPHHRMTARALSGSASMRQKTRLMQMSLSSSASVPPLSSNGSRKSFMTFYKWPRSRGLSECVRIIASPRGGRTDGGSGERVSAGVRGDSRFLCEMRGRDDGRGRTRTGGG